jgi:hypothetical protein
MARDTFIICCSYAELMKELSDSERGRLLTACMEYVEHGKEPELRGNERFVFNGIKVSLDREMEMERLIASIDVENDAIDVENSVENDAVSVENDVATSNLLQMMYDFASNDAVCNDVDANAASLPSSPPIPPLSPNSLKPPKEKPPKGGKKKVPHTDEEFDRFWAAYPRKVCKKAARKAFDKVETDIDTLLYALEQHKKSDQWRKGNGQFIPHPATWLNNERWEDELAADPVKWSAPRRWHTAIIDGEEVVVFDD